MNNKDDLWARIMSDYRCQIAAIDGMKEAMGDDFVDPRDHKGTNVEGGGGRFVSLKKMTQRGVPKGVFTIPYLLHAYNVSRSTFNRKRKLRDVAPNDVMKSTTHGQHNKGKNVINDREFAQRLFTPSYFFIQEACRHRVAPTGIKGQALTAYWGDRFDRMNWASEGEDLAKWERMAREHDAQHPFIKPALIEALESNCCRSYRNLEKVTHPAHTLQPLT